MNLKKSRSFRELPHIHPSNFQFVEHGKSIFSILKYLFPAQLTAPSILLPGAASPLDPLKVAEM
jgi:hypothetical protein